MSIRERFSAAYRAWWDPSLLGIGGGVTQEGLQPLSAVVPPDPYERYELLEAYKDNMVYAYARAALLFVARPDDFVRIRALENPALQAVQFGVMHVFPGPLSEAMEVVPGDSGTTALADAAKTVLQWSNMGAQKDSIVEDQYALGDVFLKAVASERNRRVFVDSRHPGEITEFREDNLRNIRYLRLDVELDPNEDDGYDDNATWYTELWNKEENLYVAWRHKQGRKAKFDVLGTPLDGPKAITNFGHDFVPYVRVPFEAGARPNRLSHGVFERHLESMDQLNRIATELDTLYRHNAEGVYAALRNEAGKDALEEIIDAVEEDDEDPDDRSPEEHEAHGRRIVYFPGMSRMEDMVPKIDYGVGLNKIEDRRRALERSMAELRYFRGIEGGDPAAAAIRQHQAPAIARARAAKGNAEDGVMRVVKMCLSMGAARRYFGRSGAIGTFEAGGFDTLGFAPRPIVPESPAEKTERNEARARTWKQYADMGLLEWYLQEEEGMDETRAKQIAGQVTTTSRRRSVSEVVNGG